MRVGGEPARASGVEGARGRPHRRAVGALLLAVGVAAPLAGQAGPPPAGPLPEFRLPAHTERALPGGATLVVVEDRRQPWVAVHLAFPGGRLLEPAGREGAAGLVAGLLPGTGRPDGPAAPREARLPGAELAVAVEDDAVHFRMGLPSPHLERGLRHLADVVRDPVFAPEELRALRERSAALLEARLRSPDVAADRAFLRAVYGEGHPYGALETPASLRAVERDDLLRFHRRALNLGGARIVVVGNVHPDTVEAVLARTLLAGCEGQRPPGEEEAVAGCPGGAPAADPVLPVPAPARRSRPEVVVVHDPSTPVTVVELGHVLPGARAPDWPALTVLGEVLDQRLAGLFRRRGWPHPVAARMERREGWSLLRITARVPAAVADSAAAAVFATLETLRTELARPGELRRATDVLTGSFFLGLETPEGLADALARSGLHGRPPESLEGHAARLAAAAPVELREVARARLPLAETVIAATGDAVRLRPGLRDLGPVTMVDRDGRRLDPGSLAGAAVTPGWDASALEPTELVYRLSARAVPGDVREGAPDPAGGLTPLGEMRRILERVPASEAPLAAEGEPGGPPARVLRFRTEMSWIGTRMRQEVTFSAPTFEPLAGSFSVAGRPMAASLRVDGGRVVGRVRLPDTGERDVDRPFPEGALMGEMQELALWLLDPEAGAVYRFRVVSLESGEPVDVVVRVLASDPVAVPAGRFDAWLLEVVSGDLVQRVHVRREAPHVVLRLETPGQPVVVELEAWR